MDSLRAMFPDVDPSTLQATLAAHDGSVERTVDYLLSSRSGAALPTPDPDRARQLEQDAALARRLQAEQDLSLPPARPPPSSSSPAPPFNLPSLGDVQNAVRPIVDGVTYAGRLAADSVASLYRDFLGDSRPASGSAHYHRPRDDNDDDTRVLRGEATSPASAGSARMRRSVAGAASVRTTGKKDA